MKVAKSADDLLETGAGHSLREAVFAFVVSRVRNPEMARDIVQEVLIRAAKHGATVRDPVKFEAWLFRVARNAATDHLRSLRRDEIFDEANHGGIQDDHAMVAGEEEMLRETVSGYIRGVVDALPPIYRDALRATDYEGLSQVQLGRRLGLSVSAAKSRVQRAREMVRREIEACCRWEADKYGRVLDIEPRQPARCRCDGK